MFTMKKAALLLLGSLVLASCGGGSSPELLPLDNGETYVYVNKKGEILTPSVNVKKTSLFHGKYALVAVESEAGNGQAVNRVGKNYSWGYMNAKGEMAIPAEYFVATVFSEGIAWVVKTDSCPAAINESGETLFTLPDATKVKCFREGLAAYSVGSDDGKELWGFVDKRGKVVIEPKYLEISDFSNGLAYATTTNETFGYINPKGEMVINEQFKVVGKFYDNGYATVGQSENNFGIINRKGIYQINPKYAYLVSNGRSFLAEQSDGKVGVIDANDKILIPFDFRNIMPSFLDHPYTVASMDGKKWGIIDAKGKFTANPQFDTMLPFLYGMSVTVSGRQVGIVDEQGKYILNPGSDYTDVTEDLAVYAMTGVSSYSQVETDRFDTETIVDNLAQFTNPGAFRGIDKTTTYGQVKTMYPDLSPGGYYSSASRQSLEKIYLSKDVYINRTIFVFRDSPIKTEYNYYDHKYTTAEMTDTPIASVDYELRFGAGMSGRKKDSLMGKMIQKLQQLYGAKSGTSPSKGMRLTAQDLVIDLDFSNSSQTVKVKFLEE